MKDIVKVRVPLTFFRWSLVVAWSLQISGKKQPKGVLTFEEKQLGDDFESFPSVSEVRLMSSVNLLQIVNSS